MLSYYYVHVLLIDNTEQICDWQYGLCYSVIVSSNYVVLVSVTNAICMFLFYICHSLWDDKGWENTLGLWFSLISHSEYTIIDMSINCTISTHEQVLFIFVHINQNSNWTIVRQIILIYSMSLRPYIHVDTLCIYLSFDVLLF